VLKLWNLKGVSLVGVCIYILTRAMEAIERVVLVITNSRT